MGDFLREQANDRGSGKVDYDAIEPWTRVSPHDYESNTREMIRLSRDHGAAVVLLDNELWEDSPYRPILRTIAADTGVPLVDSLRLVADAREKIERDLESRLGLASAKPDGPVAPALGAGPSSSARAPSVPASVNEPGPTRVVFRVSRGDYPVPRAIAIAGTDPQLGGVEPNVVLM